MWVAKCLSKEWMRTFFKRAKFDMLQNVAFQQHATLSGAWYILDVYVIFVQQSTDSRCDPARLVVGRWWQCSSSIVCRNRWIGSTDRRWISIAGILFICLNINQRGSYFGHVMFTIMQLDYIACITRWYLYRCFIRLYLTNLIEFLHCSSRLHKPTSGPRSRLDISASVAFRRLPLYNLTLSNTFTNIRQQEGLDQTEIHGRMVEWSTVQLQAKSVRAKKRERR